MELNPNYATAHQWYGEFLADMDRPNEAIAQSKRAELLDPLSLTINSDMGKVYLITRHYAEAVAQFKRTLELDPEFSQARGLLGLTYSLQGRHEVALAETGKIKNLESNPMQVAWSGYVNGRAGRMEEAQRMVRRLEDLSRDTYVSPLWFAFAYTGMNDKDRAFSAFDRALTEHAAAGVFLLKAHPTVDNLRADPRFAELLRRANLTP